MRRIAVVVVSILCLSVVLTLTPGAKGPGLDPVAYLKFDEGSGITAYDSSGNGNDGTLVNGTAWVSGIYGKASSYDGIDDTTEIAENTDLDPHTNDWTISAWVNIAKLTGPDIYWAPPNYGFVIVGKRQTDFDSSLTLLAHYGTSETSQAKFAFVREGYNQAAGAESTLMNVFGWHHVAGVRRGGELYVYVDGTEYGPNNFFFMGSHITSTTDIDSTTPIHLAHHGAWSGGGYNHHYNGTIDEVLIFDRALNAEEIQVLAGLPVLRALTINSVPTGVAFTAEGISHTTPWSGTYGEGSSVNLVMPETCYIGEAKYQWDKWSDSVTSRSRTVTMDTDISLTAYFIGPYYQLTATSSPITGISFTINSTAKTTPYTEWLPEGSYTLEMPQTYNGYNWSRWLEDGDTNRIKTIYLHGTTWTGEYIQAAQPPVGGEWLPIDKFQLLAPWIAAASLITAAAISSIYVKHRKKQTT